MIFFPNSNKTYFEAYHARYMNENYDYHSFGIGKCYLNLILNDSFTWRTHDCHNMVTTAHERFSRSGSRGLRLRHISNAGAQTHLCKNILSMLCVCYNLFNHPTSNQHQRSPTESCSKVVSIIILNIRYYTRRNECMPGCF